VLAAALLSVISPLRVQSTSAPDALFKTIRSLDTQLFDAYNHCDLAKLSSLVAEDLEFYHDKTGLARGRQVCRCRQEQHLWQGYAATRSRILEVYPLGNYGALEMAFIVSITRDTTIRSRPGKRSSSCYGKTRREHGRSPISSVLIINPYRSDD
jgi:hypothetical protein